MKHRYLLISSSRPGGIPANLQGIWNQSVRLPWRSNYTANINLQMNYRMAEMCNLSEMNEPLIEQIKRMAVNGTATAKNYYNMKGWAVHHNSDIWAQTNPVGEGNGDPKWANKVSGDSSFYKIAVTHANTTMKNHFRPDYSSFHVVKYNAATGPGKTKANSAGSGS